MSDLKQCPFCGGEDLVVIHHHQPQLKIDGTRYESRSVKCQSLHCQGAGRIAASEAEAIAAWNRRADGWVSVEERLPEWCDLDLQPVLAVVGYTDRPEAMPFVRTMYGPDPSDENGAWVYDELDDWGERLEQLSSGHVVTHWQPLPETPESGQ